MSYQAEYLAVAIKMALILVVMIGGLWGLSVYLKRIMKGSGGKKGGRHIRVLENSYVGVKKSISLVQIPGSILVIGLAGDRVTLLSEIDPGELKKPDDN